LRDLLIFEPPGGIPRPSERHKYSLISAVFRAAIGASRGEMRQMTTFEDREKGFERKFAHDEELKFRATARRNRLIGLWAADRMGLTGDEAQAYAREVIKADLAEPGDEDVFRKVRADFDAKGVDQSDHQIRRIIGEMMAEAVRQIEAEAKA
jgi:hypothetical protein